MCHPPRLRASSGVSTLISGGPVLHLSPGWTALLSNVREEGWGGSPQWGGFQHALNAHTGTWGHTHTHTTSSTPIPYIHHTHACAHAHPSLKDPKHLLKP